MVHLLVDAYNLMHQMERSPLLQEHSAPSGRRDPLLEDRRRWMMEILSEYQEVRDVELTLVFDGDELGGIFPQRTRFHGLSIIFSERHESADERIALLCRQSPGGYSVISSDNDVLASADLFDCPSLKSQEFVGRLERALQEKQKKKHSLYLDKTMDEIDGEEIEVDLPLYPRVSTKKKGSAKKKPKSVRRRNQYLRNL
jgi:predicted RNA-binding protein with PIN domain